MAVGAPHHDDPQEAGLYAVWVAAEAHGRGVGTALVQAVTEWAHPAGYRLLRLDVGDANQPAIRLHTHLGFTPTGTTTTFPSPREHITEHERALTL